jgi:adenylate cyclase
VVTLEPTPYLILHTSTGKRFLPLVGGAYWTLGRGDDNHFIIPDQWISRNHAMLQSTETGSFYLIDLGSRNGTFVNGRRVSVPVTLNHDDRVVLGETELEFCYPCSQLQSAEFYTQTKETLTSALHVRRLVSVLVVDIRNFTVLTQQIDENVLSLMMGTWFRQAGKIIQDSGSWVDKYIGDAVMAIWFHGEETVESEDIISIFNAISDLYKMTVHLSQQYPLPFELRIGVGLNTGFAMVGNTGSGNRPDYTALGDTVNAAFRLESATKAISLDIALGETTFKAIVNQKNAQKWFNCYTVNLKGYEQPTVTYTATFENMDNFLLDQVWMEHNSNE